jgi:hypothetical protein
MTKELLNIIDNSDEPVYEIDAFINKLQVADKDVAWNELKEISLNGDKKQKFVALTVISVNKPRYLEALSIELIKNINFSEIEPILKPIISICSIVGEEIHINFMIEVFNYALNNDREYLLEVTLRNIISTKQWKRIIDKIVDVISNSDNHTIVDLLAFFIYKQGEIEYNYLVNYLPKALQKRVIQLQKDIYKRFKENYQSLNPT